MENSRPEQVPPSPPAKQESRKRSRLLRPPGTHSRFYDAEDGSVEASSSSQRQLLQLLSIIDDGSDSLKKRTNVEAMVDIEELEEEHYFVKRARKVDANALLAASQVVVPPPNASLPILNGDDLAKKARGFLFGQPYRIGRIFTLSGSASGTGWISDVPFVITCAHVVVMAGQEELFFQLPNNTTVICLDRIFAMPEGEYMQDYQRDVAVLKLNKVVGSANSISSLPLAGISAGCLDWTCRCVTAGILAPVSPNAPNESQKMINCGIVESESSQLVTTSARADKGFSGGPLLNQSMEIIGMIEGDHGSVIKTVKIIPIKEISNILSIASQFIQGVPLIHLPMEVSGSSGF